MSQIPPTIVAKLPDGRPEAHVNAAGFVQFDLELAHPAPSEVDAARVLAHLEQVDQAAHTHLGRLEWPWEWRTWRPRRKRERGWHRTCAYDDVAGLLVSAAELLKKGFTKVAAAQVDAAEVAYRMYVDGRTRRNYVLSALVGVVVPLGLLWLLQLFGWFTDLIPHDVGYQVAIFATMGAVTSIMMRINNLDLTTHVTRVSVWISGAVRPFIAISTALVVYLIISKNLVGSIESSSQNTIAIIAAFFCGFSERFAKDFLDTAEGTLIGGKVEPTSSRSPKAPRA